MIVYCCRDLIFATKIGTLAQTVKIVARPARDIAALTDRLQRVDDGRTNDPVTAVLVDMDHDDALPLIQAARAHDAELPIVAFGAHVAVDLLQAARTEGATTVMSRGKFTTELPELLKLLARIDER